MELADALARLEAAGTEQNRKIYRRHGAKEPLFGVSFATLDAMAKQAKRDQALAEGLWATGNHDARMLACKVADPARFTEERLDAWLNDIEQYTLVDVFTGTVAARVPGVAERAARWSASTRDWTAQAGWDLYSHLAMGDAAGEAADHESSDEPAADATFEQLVARVERDVHTSGNRTRHGMNMALCAIGGRNERLRGIAEAAAGRIGPITVDHGETGCKTPSIVPYIAKIWDHKHAKAQRAAAKGAHA